MATNGSLHARCVALAAAGVIVSAMRSTAKDSKEYAAFISKDNTELPVHFRGDSSESAREAAVDFAESDMFNRVIDIRLSPVELLERAIVPAKIDKRHGNTSLQGKIWLHRVDGDKTVRIRVTQDEKQAYLDQGYATGRDVPKVVEKKPDGRTGEKLKNTFWVNRNGERKRVATEAERDEHVKDGWSKGLGSNKKAEQPVAA